MYTYIHLVTHADSYYATMKNYVYFAQGGITALGKGLAIAEAKNGVRINTYVCSIC